MKAVRSHRVIRRSGHPPCHSEDRSPAPYGAGADRRGICFWEARWKSRSLATLRMTRDESYTRNGRVTGRMSSTRCAAPHTTGMVSAPPSPVIPKSGATRNLLLDSRKDKHGKSRFLAPLGMTDTEAFHSESNANLLCLHHGQQVPRAVRGRNPRPNGAFPSTSKSFFRALPQGTTWTGWCITKTSAAFVQRSRAKKRSRRGDVRRRLL